MNPHKFQASHKTAPLYQTLSGTWTRACWSKTDLQLSVSLRPTCWDVYVLRASPMVLSMWSCTSVIGGTKSYVCRFHSGKWFWLSIIAYVAWLLKGAAALCTCRKECNKCDLTAAQYFSLAIIMIGPGGLLLVAPTYLQSQFQFYWWGCKRVHN